MRTGNGATTRGLGATAGGEAGVGSGSVAGLMATGFGGAAGATGSMVVAQPLNKPISDPMTNWG